VYKRVASTTNGRDDPQCQRRTKAASREIDAYAFERYITFKLTLILLGNA
jgi:hypothetical protein